MNRQVNKDEVRAKKYLQSLEYKEVLYEPLGNVTPDFLLDNKIAVEVRRLNRNYINSEHSLRIENFEIPLIKDIKKTISTFRARYFHSSAYVEVSLSEPPDLESKSKIRREIKRVLKYHTRHMSETKSYKIADYLELTFIPTKRKGTQYMFASCNNDAHWVVNTLHKNLQHVIDEKDKKIEKNFHLYPEWWLILVDSITYGLNEEDFEELKNIKVDKKRFSKVIILSPKGDFEAFEFQDIFI